MRFGFLIYSYTTIIILLNGHQLVSSKRLLKFQPGCPAIE